MLMLNINPVLQARGVERPFSFLVKSGFSAHTAHLLLHNQRHTFRLDHIERLCRVLICEPHDLLLWVPDKDQTYPADHPLYKLTRQAPLHDWKQTIASLPFNQLKEVTKNIAGIATSNLSAQNT